MEQLILLLLFPLIGFLCAKFNIAKPDDYRILTDLAFYVFLPCSVLVSFVTFEMNNQVINSVFLLLASLAVFAICLFLIVKKFKLDYGVSATVIMCCIFGNIIFLGLPLGETLFGQNSVSLLSLFVALHNVFAFGLIFPLIVFFGGNKKTDFNSSLMKIFKNTVVIFAIIGLIVKLGNFDFTIVVPYLKNLASLSSPVSLLGMGIYFSKNVNIDFSKNLILITVMRVLFLPILTFMVFYNSTYLKEAVFMALMPVGISNFSIIQSVSPKNQKLVLDSIFVSTVFSLVLVAILKLVNFF